MDQPAEKRRAVPLEVRLKVALRQLTEAWRASGRLRPGERIDLELDHIPALIRRAVDSRTGHHIPHQHDPDALAYKTVVEHKLKTHGNGATNRGSDRGEHSKTKRLEAKRQEREAEAASLVKIIEYPDSLPDLDKPVISRNAKSKRPMQSANRWPAKKVKEPYKRRGV